MFYFLPLGGKNRFKKLQDDDMTVWKLESLRRENGGKNAIGP